jgi:hypothetical protein
MFGIANAVADYRLELREIFAEHGMQLSEWFVDTFRDTTEQINSRPPQ